MAKEKAKVETRKDEVRYFTSEPKEMLNKYLVADVLQKWTEDFMDEDTQEVVSIERTQKLFEKGRLIDQDLLTQIQFYIQAGSIKEVEVSNQKRLAFECQNTRLHPWQAQAEIGDKKYKFLLYASGIANVIEILNDYIELNYASGFTLVMAKEMDYCLSVYSGYVITYDSLCGSSYEVCKDFNESLNIYDNIIDCIEWLISNDYFDKEYLKK